MTPEIHKELTHSQPDGEKRKLDATAEKKAMIQCDKCALNFNSDSEVSKHMLSEHHSQTRACFDCDMTFKRMSALEWLVVQRKHEENDCLIRKLNNEHNKYECDVCEFRSSDESHIKKHEKEMHAQKDVNVTPPNKKRKKVKSDEEDKNEAMEEDITEDITNQIKKCVINDKDVEMEELKELSNKQDEKVKMKQRKIDEEEAEYAKKKKDEDAKKRKRELELSVRENKNKKVNRKKLNAAKVVVKKTVELPKGLTEIHERYHTLVGNNTVKYPGPMNGNCQGASKAALLFLDPRKGPELTKEEN